MLSAASPPLPSQRGLTLLESLVALVITAVGILGAIGVQVRTLADTQTAVRRAQAVRLIDDLSERIKVHPHALGALNDYVQGWGGPTSAPPACGAGCGPGDLARRDIADWWQSVAATLPLGDAATFLAADESDAGGRRQLGVMLSWRENERRREGETDAQHTAYRAPFMTAGTGAASVECPEGRICHLQYIQPTARCTVGLLGGPTGHTLHCPLPPTP